MEQSNSPYNYNLSLEALISRYEEYRESKRSGGYFDVEEIGIIAEHYLNNGCVEEANQAIELGMRLHPESKDLLLKHVKILIEQGELTEALRILEGQFNIHEQEVLLLRIEAYVKLNRIKEAKGLARDFMTQSYNNAEFAYLDIIDIFMDAEQYALVLQYIQEGQSATPHNIDLLFAKAYCLEKLDDFDGAIQVYHDIINLDSYIEEAWFNLGQVYFTRQNYDDALHAYTMCITIDENDTLAWLQKGHIHFFNREITEAIACYTKCLDSYEEKWQLYLFLADCYIANEDFDLAMEFFTKAAQENPNNYKALIGMGICHMEKNNYQEARSNLLEASQLDPESDEAWFYLGEIEAYQQNLKKALEYYLMAYQYSDNNTDLSMTIGSVYCDLEQYDKAIPYYHKALSNAEDTQIVQILILLAICYYEEEDYNTTLYYLGEAFKINQETLDLFFNCIPEAIEVLSTIMSEKKKEKKK